jgi:hypothetical protein
LGERWKRGKPCSEKAAVDTAALRREVRAALPSIAANRKALAQSDGVADVAADVAGYGRQLGTAAANLSACHVPEPGSNPQRKEHDMASTDHKPDSIAAADERARQAKKDGPQAKNESRSPTVDQLASHPAGALAGAAAGVAAGAVSGIAAGPVGSVAGAVVGGVTGAVIGAGSSSAAGGNPVQPGTIDKGAEAAAPSIQRPGTPPKPDR